MASHLKKIIPLLEYVQSLNRVARTKYLKQVSAGVLKAICNTIFNINNGNIYIPIETVNQLRPYKRQIKSICVKKKSLEKRRKELIKSDLFNKIMTHVIPQLLKYVAPAKRDSDDDNDDNDNDKKNDENES